MNIGFDDMRFLVRVSYIKGRSAGSKLCFTVTRIFHPEKIPESLFPQTLREMNRERRRQFKEVEGQVVVLL